MNILGPLITTEINGGMTQFQELVTDCGLTNLAFIGALFTWWNKREDNPIRKKLGRILVNGDWMRCYPQSYGHFEAGGVCNHARCVVRLTSNQNEARNPFRFFSYLAEPQDFFFFSHKEGVGRNRSTISLSSCIIMFSQKAEISQASFT